MPSNLPAKSHEGGNTGEESYSGRHRYTEEKVQAYVERNKNRNAVEMALVEKGLAFIPKSQKILDIPCGYGRVTVLLAHHGHHPTAADYSEAMFDATRLFLKQHNVDCPVERQDIEAMTYKDREFEASVCFRLFHHFPNPDIRRRAVHELCRVSAHHVIISYFNPLCFTHLKRRLEVVLKGKKIKKHYTSLRELKGYFEECGFEFVKDFAHLPLVHSLHLAVFKRRETA